WTANNHEVSGGNGENAYITTAYVQNAVKPLLAHFGDRVKLWELWNEPNAYQSCNGAACSGGSFIYPSNFAALLADSYAAINDPAPAGLGLTGITIISGGLLGHSIGGALTSANAGAAYLKNTFTMGITIGSWTAFADAHGGNYPLDGIGQHLYLDQNLLTTTTDLATYYGWLRAAAAGFETPQPTFLTEGAWSTSIVPQSIQAMNLDLLFGTSRAVGYVPHLTWFELQDVPQNNLYFGLTDSSLNPKQAYDQYRTETGGAATSTPTTSATATVSPTSTSTATATTTPTTGQTVTIPIPAGWSFVTLPLAPTTPLDAQTVLTSLLAQTHGGYAEIDAYASSRFSPSLYDDPHDGLGIGGTNFTLQLGHGYALYSDTAGSLSVTGTPAAAQPITLAAGWNLVGFPDAGTNPVKADDFLSALLAQTHGGYAEIDGYASSRFTPSAYDDPRDGLGLGGTNFTVQPGQGYALYTDVGTTVIL
ncbi:MAG TPA: hypothetical protein VNL71_04945, partial [Chloroflexota bacterium]|nr:hypothetical protein [Chloroflexota bacterium]